MKKYISYLVVLLVGFGFGFLVFHKGATPHTGAQVQNDTFNFTGGFNAGSTNQFTVSSAGAVSSTAGITAATYSSASVGNSTSVPASLGSAASGVFTVGTGTPATRLGQASTTAVTATSKIFVQQTTVAPDSGTTCNTTTATSSAITTIASGSGFVLTVGSIPATNPQCWMYWIVN